MKADDEKRFHNKRAETYWRLSEDIANNLLELPDDDILAEELLATEYFFTSAGRMQIISKKDIKELIGRSPDRADSLALTYFTKNWSLDGNSELGASPHRQEEIPNSNLF